MARARAVEARTGWPHPRRTGRRGTASRSRRLRCTWPAARRRTPSPSVDRDGCRRPGSLETRRLLCDAASSAASRARACASSAPAGGAPLPPCRAISSLTDASSRWRSPSWLSIEPSRGALGDDPDCRARGLSQLRASGLDFLAEPLDVLQDLGVLVAHALGDLEAAEEVVEALRAEDHLDRAARVAVDVEGPQALRDVRLRDAEARFATTRCRPFASRSASIWSSCSSQVVRLDRVRELDPSRWIWARIACASSRLELIGVGGGRAGPDGRDAASAARPSPTARTALSSSSCRP